MQNNLFEIIKEQLPVPDVARYYGLEMNRSGFTSCFFHSERTPSMKLYEENYHCFGCGAHGDVIDLTGALFNLSPMSAAQKLAQDFGIAVFGERKTPKVSIKAKIQHYNIALQEERAYRLLNDYCGYLSACRQIYAPKSPEETAHPLFLRSFDLEKHQYYRDIFIDGTKDERQGFIRDFSGVLSGIERALKEGKREREAVEMA
jgi:hypothetical protein